MKNLLCLCLLVALTGCSRDMYAPYWAVAVKQCESHGGVVSADWTSMVSNRVMIEAYCADNSMVKGFLARDGGR
jgi:hypothetical protein